MLRDFKFYDKYYVGVEKSRYASTEDQRLLGFATPIDATSAYEKRKETVDRWRDSTVEPIIIDNTPTFGFEIVDVVSRYRTDNKLYRVYDPRGFELEISAENLFDILLNNTIVKGKVMEPLVWARSGAKNYLVSSSCEEYKNHLAPKKETPALAPGQYFTHRGNTKIIYRYEGRFHSTSIEKEMNTYNPANHRTGYYYYDRYGPTHKKQNRGGVQTYVKYTWKTPGKEPYEIYTEFHLNKEDKVQAYKVHLRKSKLKDLDYLGDTSDNPEIVAFQIPVGKYLAQFEADFGTTEIEYENGNVYKTNKLDYIVNGYTNSPDIRRREVILFKSRPEANAHKFTIAEANAILKPLAEYEYRNGNYVESLTPNSKNFGSVFYELFKDDQLVEEFE